MSDNRAGAERRTNAELRALFPAACEALRPFFDASKSWGGQSQDHLAYQTLKEHFPEMTSQDAFITVSAVRRVLASGKVPTAT